MAVVPEMLPKCLYIVFEDEGWLQCTAQGVLMRSAQTVDHEAGQRSPRTPRWLTFRETPEAAWERNGVSENRTGVCKVFHHHATFHQVLGFWDVSKMAADFRAFLGQILQAASAPPPMISFSPGHATPAKRNRQMNEGLSIEEADFSKRARAA